VVDGSGWPNANYYRSRVSAGEFLIAFFRTLTSTATSTTSMINLLSSTIATSTTTTTTLRHVTRVIATASTNLIKLDDASILAGNFTRVIGSAKKDEGCISNLLL
jgi:hypothetical protein